MGSRTPQTSLIDPLAERRDELAALIVGASDFPVIPTAEDLKRTFHTRGAPAAYKLTRDAMADLDAWAHDVWNFDDEPGHDRVHELYPDMRRYDEEDDRWYDEYGDPLDDGDDGDDGYGEFNADVWALADTDTRSALYRLCELYPWAARQIVPVIERERWASAQHHAEYLAPWRALAARPIKRDGGRSASARRRRRGSPHRPQRRRTTKRSASSSGDDDSDPADGPRQLHSRAHREPATERALSRAPPSLLTP